MATTTEALSKLGSGVPAETLDDIEFLKRDVTDEEYQIVIEMQSAVDAAILDAIPYLREIVNAPDQDPEVRVSALRVLTQGVGGYVARRREYVGEVKRGKGAVFNINMPDYTKPVEDGEVISE